MVEGSFTESASSSLDKSVSKMMNKNEFDLTYDQDQTFEENLRQKFISPTHKKIASEVTKPTNIEPNTEPKEEQLYSNSNVSKARNSGKSGNINWTLSNRTDSKRI